MVEPSLVPVGLDLGGEAAGLLCVGEGGVAVPGGGVGVGEIDEETCAGPDEVSRETCKSVGELVDGVGCTEACQGVAAPAIEMGIAQEQERQRGVGGEQAGGGVEGSPGVVSVSGDGEGFAVGGGEPGRE